MFVQTVTAPLEEWEHWNERLRITADPPPTLVAAIAWKGDDGLVTAVNLWDSPEAIADFFMERVNPIVMTEGEPANKPQVRGAPLAVYIRR